jgi:uncharacterized protein (TIGR02646 family)
VIAIKKGDIPGWFSELLERHPSIGNYADLSFADRQRLRSELLNEQFHVCGYCCGRVYIDGSHIEHIVPQAASKKRLDLDYGNMIASCRGFHIDSDTCGHKKGGRYSSMLISPLDLDCEQNFEYRINGEIVGMNKNAIYTIDLLNLNTGALKNARRGVLKQSMSLSKRLASEMYLEPYEGKLQPLCNIVNFFLEKHTDLFDTIE